VCDPSPTHEGLTSEYKMPYKPTGFIVSSSWKILAKSGISYDNKKLMSACVIREWYD